MGRILSAVYPQVSDDPRASSFTEPPAQVLENVRAIVADVLAEQAAGDLIPRFDATVATADTVAAEHDQVRRHIVAWMLAHVVEGQPEYAGDVAADRTLPPFEMERP